MKPRPIKIEGDVAYVPLTRGMTAIIDAQDAPLAQSHNWYAKASRGGLFYAARDEYLPDGSKRIIRLHREIVGAPDDIGVDHKDRDTMNCRRGNLRIAAQATNIQNGSLRSDNKIGFRGVSHDPRRPSRPFYARIGTGGKMKSLGRHATAEEAARAYDSAARALYGADAYLNFRENA